MVWPVERRNEYLRVDEVELLEDVFAREFVGRGRERHHRHVRKLGFQEF